MEADALDWSRCSPTTEKIFVGTHNLSLSCCGPSRQRNEPAVIIIQGIASSLKEWPIVIREVSSFARIYSYERSGFGHSDVSPHDPTAEQIAAELDMLLTRANVDPPYVLVCHSYGGVITREFVHRRPGSVAGIVFVDANTEETPTTYPNPVVQAMQKGLNTLEVTIGDSHKLLPDEWEALLAAEDDPRNDEAGSREVKHYHDSGRTLAAKHQIDCDPPLFGDAPLVILHANYALDLQRIYHAGCATGNGSPDERQAMEKFVSEANEIEEKMQRKMLKLSAKARFQYVPDSGHYIHMVRPDIVVDAVREVLQKTGRTV